MLKIIRSEKGSALTLKSLPPLPATPPTPKLPKKIKNKIGAHNCFGSSKFKIAIYSLVLFLGSFGAAFTHAEDIATETTQQANRQLLSAIDKTTGAIKLDEDDLHKWQQAKDRLAFTMDQLDALTQRSQLLTKDANGQTQAAPLNGFNQNAQGQLTGANAGYVGNLMSPMDHLPIASQSLLPSQISALSQAGAQTLVQKASTFLQQAGQQQLTGIISSLIGNTNGLGINPLGGVMATASTINGAAQPNQSQALTGAAALGDGMFVRPAAGQNGSVDAAYLQEFLAGTPAQKLQFLAATSNSSQSYVPQLGSIPSSQGSTTLAVNMDDVLTNGAAQATGGSAGPYAGFAAHMAATLASKLSSVSDGSALTVTPADVQAAEQANLPAATIDPAKYSLSPKATSTTSLSGIPLIAVSGPPSASSSAAPSSNLVSVVGPTTDQVNTHASNLAASNQRLSEIQQQMAAVQQQITYTQSLLKNARDLMKQAQALSQKVSQAQGNATGELALFIKTCQDSASDYEKQIFDMNGMIERLKQRRFNELVRRDEMVQAMRDGVKQSIRQRQFQLETSAI